MLVLVPYVHLSSLDRFGRQETSSGPQNPSAVVSRKKQSRVARLSQGGESGQLPI